MVRALKIAVEGFHAGRALEELLAISEVQGSVENTESEAIRRDGVLVAIGIIVAITSGTVTVVDKIIAWRDKWKSDKEAKHLNVVIEDAHGNRLALDGATPEQIAAALTTLAH